MQCQGWSRTQPANGSRLLEYIQPNVVHIMLDGKIVDSGGSDMAQILEEKGYDNWM